jgi:hypothetical protein
VLGFKRGGPWRGGAGPANHIGAGFFVLAGAARMRRLRDKASPIRPPFGGGALQV